MGRNFSSIAVPTTLAASCTSGATSLSLTAVSGYPSTPFSATIDPGTASEEIVTVTNIVGTTATVTRGEDGTVGVAHSTGAVFRHMASGRDLQESQDHNDATANVHGIGTGSSVVGTNTTQTLDHKTFQSSSTSATALAVQAVTSQTADLQAWKDAGGTTVASVTPAGGVEAKSVTTSGGTVLGVAPSTTTSGVTGRGVASQTGAVVRAEDSSGTQQVGLYANGNVTASGTVAATGALQGGSASISGTATVGAVSSTGAVSGGSVSATGDVSGATAHITGAATVGSVAATGDVAGGTVHSTGTATVGSLSSSGAVSGSTVSATGAVSGASVSATGQVSGATADFSGLAIVSNNYAAMSGDRATETQQIKFGSSVVTTNAFGQFTLNTGLTTLRGFVCWNGDANSRANITMANNRGNFPATSNGYVSATCWVASSGTAMASTDIRIDWIAFGV